eukprot:764483-Hanusia_phi.AAC.3
MDHVARLRGGKDIPIDMRIVHWLTHSRGGQIIAAVMLACGIYMVPALPRISSVNPIYIQQVLTLYRARCSVMAIHPAQFKLGVVLLIVGTMLFLAGPIIKFYLGAYQARGDGVQCSQAVGEAIADARDEQLDEETG